MLQHTIMKYTAGIWVYKKTVEGIKILLVHPGGPFYKNKDEGVWSAPKGEYNPEAEDAFEVAKREFKEETGNVLIAKNFIPLTAVKTKGCKLLTTWAVESDFDQPFISSNTFALEWPPKSGKIEHFPETDNAEWFNFDDAAKKVNGSQLPVLKELRDLLEK